MQAFASNHFGGLDQWFDLLFSVLLEKSSLASFIKN